MVITDRRINAKYALVATFAVFCLFEWVEAVSEDDIYSPLPPAQSLHGLYCRVCFTLVENFGSIFKDEKRLFSRGELHEILTDFSDSAKEVLAEDRVQSTALSLGPMPPTVAEQKIAVRHLIESRREEIVDFLSKPPAVVKAKKGGKRQSTDFKKWDVRFCGEAVPVCKPHIDQLAAQEQQRIDEDNRQKMMAEKAAEQAEAEKQAATGKKKKKKNAGKKKKKNAAKKKKAKKAAAAPPSPSKENALPTPTIADSKNEL